MKSQLPPLFSKFVFFFILSLLVFVPFGRATPTTQTSGDPLSASSSIPALPDVVGCYELVNGAWQSNPCISSTQEQSYNMTATEGGSTYGVEGVDAGVTTIEAAQVTVSFSALAGETDSSYGSNSWSIQLNTNVYNVGGSAYWAQFTEQNNPNYWLGGYGQFCIWQVDLTTNSYPNTCTNTTIQSLSTSGSPFVQGALSSSGGTNYLTGDYCKNGTTCWGVTVKDNNGLTGNWITGSGTILGMAHGSTADFSHTTHESTSVLLVAPSSFSGSKYSDTETAEMNNFNLGTTSISCNSNSCTTTASSSI
jgi:hypothetical protein